MYICKPILLAIGILLLFCPLLYSAVEPPEPILPPPTKIFWEKIKPSPYTMVIRSKRYGDFNFTREADDSLDEYKMLCKAADYSMEIPAVASVNKKQEIVDLITCPGENILLLNIDINEICEYNRDNPSLIERLKNPSLGDSEKDDIIQGIIANAIYHPLGRFCLIRRSGKKMILASVLKEKVFLPIDCVNLPLNSLIRKDSLSRGFTLRKDWYIIATPSTCYWTEYFMNYIEIESKKMEVELKIPIHLHPWRQMGWLLETKEGYWLSEFRIHLIPSGRDIDFFKSRFPDAGLYIIVGKDLYSEELDWAVYDDIPLLEKEVQNLEVLKWDPKRIKNVLDRINGMQGEVFRYYKGKDRGLIIDKEIDSLLVLNKRQMGLLKAIEDYKNRYPWRLSNTSFFIPVLNEQLAKKGWRIVPNKRKVLGYNLRKREFYYKDGITARMDLFLFILFNLCYIEADDLSGGLDTEAKATGLLKDICRQIDYLCVRYYHMEGFSKHTEYLSNIIRHNIWEREKRILIAGEQINHGREYLDRYNLGHYQGVSGDNLKLISALTFSDISNELQIEDIIKRLSQMHSIKNEEEFIMEFEKQLILAILSQVRE